MEQPKIKVGIFVPEFHPQFEDCLQALCAQSIAPAEICITSPRPTAPEYLSQYPVQFKSLPQSKFGLAHNSMIQHGSYDYYLCLDPHIHLAPDFLQWCLACFRHGRTELGAVDGLLMLQQKDGALGSTVYSRGMQLSPTRLPGLIDYGTPSSDLHYEPEFVFGPAGLCTLFDRKALLACSQNEPAFDPQLSHASLAEFAWRFHRRGWKCLNSPDARAWIHSMSPMELWQHSHSMRKERLLMMLRHDKLRDLLRLFPALALGEFLFSLGHGFQKPSTLLDSLSEGLRLLPKAPHFWSKREKRHLPENTPISPRPTGPHSSHRGI